MDKSQEIINKLKYIEGYIDGLCWAATDEIAEALDGVSREIADLTLFIIKEKK